MELLILPTLKSNPVEVENPNRVRYEVGEAEYGEQVIHYEVWVVFKPLHLVNVQGAGESHIEVDLHGQGVQSIPVEEPMQFPMIGGRSWIFSDDS